jgi:hypothetical protein
MSLLGNKEFTQDLLTTFPELRDELQDEMVCGLLHFEVACFANYTQDAIDKMNYQRLTECYRFADNFFRSAVDELRNVLFVTSLECGRLN